MELLQCMGAKPASVWLIVVALFVASYLIYRTLLMLSRRAFNEDGVWKQIVEAFRFPTLVILLEIAAVISVNILGIKELYEEIFEHTLTVVIIATIGWLLARITRSVYHYFFSKYEQVDDADEKQREMLTQTLFLYRLISFLVWSVTLAAILLTFPHIKSVGIGILSSAGIAGIALGVAARPILLNLMAGFQIAMTKTIKIGDAVVVEGDFARIEAIQLTHVIARTWDMRRFVLPISHFIDKPFQNWDTKDPELLGSVFLYCDYSAPVDAIREKVKELIDVHPHWNKKVWNVHVTNCTEKTMELRIIMTANDAASAFQLRAHVREKLVEFLQANYPTALPSFRVKNS